MTNENPEKVKKLIKEISVHASINTIGWYATAYSDPYKEDITVADVPPLNNDANL